LIRAQAHATGNKEDSTLLEVAKKVGYGSRTDNQRLPMNHFDGMEILVAVGESSVERLGALRAEKF
jgi:hypothetical protein